MGGGVLQSFDRQLERVSVALSWVACAIIPFMFTMIVIDVSIRQIGYTPPLFTSSVVEYALLYLAAFSAPWLVRVRGHVAIEALVTAMPDWMRRPLAKAVYLVCATVSFGFTYLSFKLFWDALLSGELDVRGVDMPYWALFFPLVPAFLLVGLEFCMFLAGIRSYYSYDLGEVKDGV